MRIEREGCCHTSIFHYRILKIAHLQNHALRACPTKEASMTASLTLNPLLAYEATFAPKRLRTFNLWTGPLTTDKL